ncbi:hypothetical protein M747DRAFT_297064 [Aspergillus niger ATCC 13496]|uniref:Uncharacterized protein n=1 Tax=Aspergillus niger ATCC 13496 TaxID=1353008 RepID=A0A370BTG4_ASPNG|nr:hypothetical protein M747DRAFT_297064 [Aspergillus niger ATCC 13496]
MHLLGFVASRLAKLFRGGAEAALREKSGSQSWPEYYITGIATETSRWERNDESKEKKGKGNSPGFRGSHEWENKRVRAFTRRREYVCTITH